MDELNTPKKRVVIRVRRDISKEIDKTAGRAVLPPSRPNGKPKNRKPEPKPKGPATLPKTSIRKMEMEAAGLKYYTFAQKIDMMEAWFSALRKAGIKPNDRFASLIAEDVRTLTN